MGNNSTKESRSSDHPGSSRAPIHTYLDNSAVSSVIGADRPAPTARSRVGRAELNLFGLGTTGSSSSQTDQPFERRETKAEREARRLERERVLREKERDRSMREEHVDGGFLVTLGTYTGVEDFNKQIVRQLQVRRQLASHLTTGEFVPLIRVSLDRAQDCPVLARLERLL